MDFEEFKQLILKNAKKVGVCSGEYKRAYQSESIEELIEVIKDNLDWVADHEVLTAEIAKQYEKPELFNIGKDNTGLFNSGDRNSGDLNSGDLNSGDLNSGYRNSGYRNSGDLNSGDLNSGYRNSGVFCTRKRKDTVPFFNKESNMTWDEWYNHPAYNASFGLTITEWVDWDNMTDEERKEKPKAFVCGGYVKTYGYKEAWVNLWGKLSESERNSFKTLPNYNPDIFEEITGIRY